MRPHDRNNPNCWCGPVVIRNCGIDMTDDDAEVVDNGKHIIFDHCRFGFSGLTEAEASAR